MHEAQHYFNNSIGSRLSSTVKIDQIILTEIEAANLKNALISDASSYFHSSCISLADAIHGLESNFFTWTIVKSYYSCFYSLRAILALNNIGVIYDSISNPNKSTPYEIIASTNSHFSKGKGTTHKFIINLFTRHFPTNPIVNHQIDTKPPLIWLMEQREIANYKNAKFVEPIVPSNLFGIVNTNNLKQTLSSYVNDTDDIYTFDKDHAIVAMPINLINKTKNHINLSLDEKEIINNYLKCKNGSLRIL